MARNLLSLHLEEAGSMQSPTLADYRQALRENVCNVCCQIIPARPGSEARCARESDGSCPIFAKLESVLETVSAVRSPAMQPYVEELRRRVCAHCEHQDENGVCDLRDATGPDHPWCLLDTYYNRVVAAIERVQGAQRPARG